MKQTQRGDININRTPHGQRFSQLAWFYGSGQAAGLGLETDYRPRSRTCLGGGEGSTDQEQIKLGSQCSMNTKSNAISVCGTELNCVCLLRTEQDIRGGTRHSVTRLYLVIPNQ